MDSVVRYERTLLIAIISVATMDSVVRYERTLLIAQKTGFRRKF